MSIAVLLTIAMLALLHPVNATHHNNVAASGIFETMFKSLDNSDQTMSALPEVTAWSHNVENTPVITTETTLPVTTISQPHHSPISHQNMQSSAPMFTVENIPVVTTDTVLPQVTASSQAFYSVTSPQSRQSSSPVFTVEDTPVVTTDTVLPQVTSVITTDKPVWSHTSQMDNSLDTHGRFGSHIRQNPIYTTTIQKPVTVLESTLSPPLTIHSSTVTTDRPVWSQTKPYSRFGSKIHHGRYVSSLGRSTTQMKPVWSQISQMDNSKPVWSHTSQMDNSFNRYGRFGSKIHHGGVVAGGRHGYGRYLQSYGRRGGFAAGGSRGGFVARGPRGGYAAGGYRRGGFVGGRRRGNRYLEENQ